MKLLKTALASTFAVLLLCSAARAQTPAPSPSQVRDGAADASGGDADISITAHVTARELRFEKVPNPTVEFTGKPERKTVWEADRENLPAQVQPGVTYRDIGIRLRITSVFADIDRIVAEALGEIPPGDETRRAQPEATTQASNERAALAPVASARPQTSPAKPSEVPAQKARQRSRRGTRR